jgi:hypothetical protein
LPSLGLSAGDAHSCVWPRAAPTLALFPLEDVLESLFRLEDVLESLFRLEDVLESLFRLEDVLESLFPLEDVRLFPLHLSWRKGLVSVSGVCPDEAVWAKRYPGAVWRRYLL